jgi:hypothetical protein
MLGRMQFVGISHGAVNSLNPSESHATGFLSKVSIYIRHSMGTGAFCNSLPCGFPLSRRIVTVNLSP